jgi:acyl dehydratase
MSDRVRIITGQEIRQYVEATENFAPEFLAAADAAGFSKIIAPSGFLGQYRMFCSEERVPKGGVHIKHTMKFRQIVQDGDYITASIVTGHSKDAKGRDLLIYTATFKNQKGEVVGVGEMTNLMAT